MSKNPELHSFHSFVLNLDGGGINDMLTEAMHKASREVADACCERGGTHEATITLKLKFRMDQKDKVMEVFPSVDEKLPKAPLGRAGMFFIDKDGKFTKENPRQLTIDDELARKRLDRETAEIA